MTTLEALVSMSQTLLRARGEWQGGATAYADMDWAVNRINDLRPEPKKFLCEMAITELTRRAGSEIVLLGA